MLTRSPLIDTTEDDLFRLSQALWDWPVCTHRRLDGRCLKEGCPGARFSRLARFFEYYRDLAASYECDLAPGEIPALNSHEDLFEIIRELKSNPALTRIVLVLKTFPPLTTGANVSKHDQERAINLAVKVMMMINCVAQNRSASILELGNLRAPWKDDIPFRQFITEMFPTTDHPGVNNSSEDEELGIDMKTSLTAKKLKKHAGLKFKPTDDMRSHLKLDRKKGIVEIYHHTAFLKEHLRLTKDEAENQSVTDQLKAGALPRGLCLEILDSLQKILFPLSHQPSKKLLTSMVSRMGLDPDILRFESASIRLPSETTIEYRYFGARLADLYEEMQNPVPRGGLQKWFERRSGARYVMVATVIGVIIAIVLGATSLAVSSWQAWIAWQAWKHPVSPP
ncbi:hypothetical protein F5884DRAFT_686099 [Xylogone sp. PMI_703]|nr:hypothetical protein F5884DRAFT_686099 [Xylogone sp. PMI_703]